MKAGDIIQTDSPEEAKRVLDALGADGYGAAVDVNTIFIRITSVPEAEKKEG
jgi:hypothetical protein